MLGARLIAFAAGGTKREALRAGKNAPLHNTKKRLKGGGVDPLELVGAGGASSVMLGIVIYLLRSQDRRSEAKIDQASQCSKQLESLSRAIQAQQEINAGTLEAMRDLMTEVRSVVQAIQTTMAQRIAIEEDRRKRSE